MIPFIKTMNQIDRFRSYFQSLNVLDLNLINLIYISAKAIDSHSAAN